MNQQPAGQHNTRIQTQTGDIPRECRLVDECIEEYVLGIIDPDRCSAIDQHRRTCTRCELALVSFTPALTALALAVPVAEPPASARAALMSRIATTPQRAAPPRNVYTGRLDTLRTPSLPASSTGPAAAAPPRSPQVEQSSWWKVYAAPLATLPLLLALGLVGAWGFNNYTKLNDSKQAVAAKDQQIAMMNQQISNGNNQGIVELVSSPSAKRYALYPEVTSAADAARGTLFADPRSQVAAVQVSGLATGIYTVVVQTPDGEMVPKANFSVGADGSASTLVNLGMQVSDLQSVHIRPTTTVTQTDVAVMDAAEDVLFATIGPDIFENADTSPQTP
ncbi:MAG: hypothetical protein KC438_07415 [Thermomicrobiales bacterium]|nr:hypothetical protein [Thermomicrobiales bacterium]MCO5220602.1 hypothetical protein [Thermomicrobiales bacterium]